MSEPGRQMAAEMAEQPAVLAALVGRRAGLVASLRPLVGSPVGIVLVARGSSDHAAIYGRYLLELVTGRPVALAAPSLVTRYGVSGSLDGWLAVGVSQSGRTPEIVSVLSAFAERGARTVAITNDETAPLAGVADATIATAAGDEAAVPATKTLTAQCAAFAILAEALGGAGDGAGAGDPQGTATGGPAGALPWSDADWDAVPDAVAAVLDDPAPARQAAERIGAAPAMAVLGRGLLLAGALEVALKLEEISGIVASGASTADFRHGPIAMVGKGFPVLALSAGGPVQEDVEELVTDLRSRGGDVQRLATSADAELPVASSLPEALALLPLLVRGQQLARELGLWRGIDPDAPLGLSKVTVTH